MAELPKARSRHCPTLRRGLVGGSNPMRPGANPERPGSDLEGRCSPAAAQAVETDMSLATIQA